MVGNVSRRSPSRIVVPAGVVAFLMVCMAMGGFNSPVGKLLTGIGGLSCLAVMVALYRPTAVVWSGLRWPALWIAGAFGWLVMGYLGIGLVPFAGSPQYRVPDLFLPEVASMFGCWGLFVTCFVLGHDRIHAARTMRWLVSATAALFLIALLVRLSGQAVYFSDWQLAWQGRFAGPIGNSNTTAVISGAFATIAAGWLLRAVAGSGSGGSARRGPDRLALVVAGASFLALLASLLATESRVPLVLAGAALALVWHRRSSADVRPKWSPRVIAGALLVGALLLLIMWNSVQDVTLRFRSFGDEVQARWLLWQHGRAIVEAAPVYGYGPGSFFAINTESMRELWQARAFWRINSAHNLAIQFLVVGGLPYLAMLVAAAWPIAKDLVKSWGEALHDPVVSSWLLAVAQILCVAMVDITLDSPAGQLILCVLVGLLAGRAWERKTSRRAESQAAARSK